MNSSSLRLLSSYTPFEYDLVTEVVESETITEDDKGNKMIVPAVKKTMMKGILQKADTVNQNGRVYPGAVLEREIRNYQKFILENRALGECDHPDSSVINLKNVSHIVREASMKDGVVRGTIEILDKTPSGAILKGLIDSGVKLGISSRGVGTTQKKGDYVEVQEDFQLICFDIVSEPSTPGAFLIPEGKSITLDELRETFTKSDRINRVLNEILCR